MERAVRSRDRGAGADFGKAHGWILSFGSIFRIQNWAIGSPQMCGIISASVIASCSSDGRWHPVPRPGIPHVSEWVRACRMVSSSPAFASTCMVRLYRRFEPTNRMRRSTRQAEQTGALDRADRIIDFDMVSGGFWFCWRLGATRRVASGVLLSGFAFI